MNYKTAMLIGEKFPGKRVDFLTKQVVNLIRVKPDSKVIVLHEREKMKKEIEDVKKYKILEKTYFLNLPRGKLNRLLSISSVFAHPIVFLKSLNPKYYPMNLTLKHYLTYNSVKKLPFKIGTLHCHFGQIGIIGSFLKDNNACEKLVVSFYGGDLTGYVGTYGNNVYKETFDKADYLVVCTEFLKKRLIELGADPNKIIMVYLPQDSTFFKPSKNWKRKDEIKILTVARLVKEKGIQNSLKAIYILSQKYNNLRYTIVGDGGYKEELIKLVKEYNLQNIVEFVGVKSGKDALKEYQSADIFVLPSISTHKSWVEGGGLTNLEAQLCETPVVASNCGGIPEYVLDGVTGFLAQENAEDLALKISLLIENKKLREKMGRDGRKMVKKKHSMKNLDILKKLYFSLD